MRLTDTLTMVITADGWTRRVFRQLAYRTDAGEPRYRWCITCLGCGHWQWVMHFLGGEPCDCHSQRVA